MSLPIIPSGDQNVMIIQQRWSSLLNPVLQNLLVQGSLLQNVQLIDGTTTFNHYLGKQMTGWQIIDRTAADEPFRPDDFPLNQTTLTLTSSAAMTVSIWVF